jgi:ATP-dependent DNA helicase DinG
LVVANHALVLAEAANPGSGILPAYGRLVFDEAHNLEDIATDFFSFEFSRQAFAQIAAKITRRQRGGRGREKGVLGTVQRQLDRGALASAKEASALRSTVHAVRTATAFAQLEADTLLECASHLLSPGPAAECIRYRRVADSDGNPGARQYSLHGLFKNYESSQWDEQALAAAFSKFEARLADVADSLVKLAEMLGGGEDGEFNFFSDLSVQAAAVAESVRKYLVETKFVLSGSEPDYVFWAERARGAGRPKDAPSLRLVAAPLSVAEQMRRCFYRMKDSVVLCSATLRVGDRFDYIAKRLGLADESGTDEDVIRSRRLVASSPFDYFRQALVMAPDFLPDPAADTHEYAGQLAEFLPQLFDAVGGRGLVLFTAYEMMRETAEKSRSLFEAAGLSLLVQGDGMSRETMTAELKRNRRTVLFGAQSFWEGVDVSGDALSCVVIARLPFPQMGEPVIEARSAKIEAEGGSSFRDYMVPEAVMKFRQGFGRLVRTKSDRGVVVIADKRVVSKNYGAIFRKSIAASVHSVSSKAAMLERVKDFFAF